MNAMRTHLFSPRFASESMVQPHNAVGVLTWSDTLVNREPRCSSNASHCASVALRRHEL